MRILICLANDGSRLSKPFQICLNAAMRCAAEVMRGRPITPLYKSNVRYQAEPWAGQGVEEFADPWTVLQRGWGDCDDLVIYRGAELIANGYPCHAQVVRNTKLNKYHTQLRRDFGPSGVVEDPCLKLMGRPLEQWLIRSS